MRGVPPFGRLQLPLLFLLPTLRSHESTSNDAVLPLRQELGLRNILLFHMTFSRELFDPGLLNRTYYPPKSTDETACWPSACLKAGVEARVSLIQTNASSISSVHSISSGPGFPPFKASVSGLVQCIQCVKKKKKTLTMYLKGCLKITCNAIKLITNTLITCIKINT